MKIARFRANSRVVYGVIQGDQVVEIRGSIFSKFRMTDAVHALTDVKLLAPTDPVEIWCPGLNFLEHLEFAGQVLGHGTPPIPTEPQPWRKGRNALTGPNDPIIIPRASGGDVHYEGEAVAVISKDCRRVTPQQAEKFILGYTCGNDVSDRTWQGKDFSFWRAKGSDTFSPVGPWIETEISPNNLDLMVRINSKEVQHCNTSDMMFSFPEIISCISQQVTLRPGDLVFSGATGVTVAIKPGDVVEVDIPGIGVLKNNVEQEF